MTDESLFAGAEKRIEAEREKARQHPLTVEKVFDIQVKPFLEELKLDFYEKQVPQNFFRLANECEQYIVHNTSPDILVVRSEAVCLVDVNTDEASGKEELVNRWIKGNLAETTPLALGILLKGRGVEAALRYGSHSKTWKCGMGNLYTGYSYPGPHIVANFSETKIVDGEQALNQFVDKVFWMLKGGHYKAINNSGFSVEEIAKDRNLFS